MPSWMHQTYLEVYEDLSSLYSSQVWIDHYLLKGKVHVRPFLAVASRVKTQKSQIVQLCKPQTIY